MLDEIREKIESEIVTLTHELNPNEIEEVGCDGRTSIASRNELNFNAGLGKNGPAVILQARCFKPDGPPTARLSGTPGVDLQCR